MTQQDYSAEDDMDENILVVKKKYIPYQGTGLFSVTREQLLEWIDGHIAFLPRGEMEEDESYHQIIPYVVIRYGTRLFVTERLNKQREARLHGKLSFGIGGHINTLEEHADDVLTTGMLRELFEEVDIDLPREQVAPVEVGILLNDADPVSRVHMGMVYILDVQSDCVTVRETEKMTGSFVEISELARPDLFDRLEGWSQVVYKAIFAK